MDPLFPVQNDGVESRKSDASINNSNRDIIGEGEEGEHKVKAASIASANSVASVHEGDKPDEISTKEIEVN